MKADQINNKQHKESNVRSFLKNPDSSSS